MRMFIGQFLKGNSMGPLKFIMAEIIKRMRKIIMLINSQHVSY